MGVSLAHRYFGGFPLQFSAELSSVNSVSARHDAILGTVGCDRKKGKGDTGSCILSLLHSYLTGSHPGGQVSNSQSHP